MKPANNMKKLSVLSFSVALLSPAVHAHPGHIADESVHGLLHSEHILALAAAVVIACTVYLIRSK